MNVNVEPPPPEVTVIVFVALLEPAVFVTVSLAV